MTQTSYDEIPYAAMAFPLSHPDRLSLMAHLRGMKPASVEKCRVLDLGCAVGGNILPMADALRQSEFIGIDLSGKQIEIAKDTANKLGLANIQFIQKNILDLGPELGKFDYIIAHGLYSWVPDDVRKKAGELISQLLTPQGVAYISFNAYPGWRLRDLVRDLMRYETRGIVSPKEKVKSGKAILDLVIQTLPSEQNVYGMYLKQEAGILRDSDDSYLLHDHLSGINRPFYFHEFAAQMDRHGLQFLCEAERPSVRPEDLPDPMRQKFDLLDDEIEKQQWMDFVTCCSFRRSLLCRKDMELKRQPNPQMLQGLYAATPAKDVSTELSQIYPRRLVCSELSESMHASLLEQFNRRKLDLYTRQIDFATKVSEKPMASAYARQQASQMDKVVNRLHDTITIGIPARLLLPYIDGTRTASDLVNEMQAMAERRVFQMTKQGQPLPPSEVRAVLERDVNATLSQLAAASLLL